MSIVGYSSTITPQQFKTIYYIGASPPSMIRSNPFTKFSTATSSKTRKPENFWMSL